jgi:hypothetical protein
MKFVVSFRSFIILLYYLTDVLKSSIAHQLNSISSINSDSFSDDELGALPPFDNKVSDIVRELLNRSSIEYKQNMCLSNTDMATHAINLWGNAFSSHANWNSEIPHLPGKTYWINEYMAVGHLMYDLQLLELLQHENTVDRIVAQRAPCATKDLCQGVGTWHSFFEGFYRTAIISSGLNIPIYLRFYPTEKTLSAIFLNGNYSNGNSSSNIPLALPVKKAMCFEHIYRKVCNKCFQSSIRPITATKFKNTAYSLNGLKNDSSKIFEKDKILITIAHRGKHYRSMSNYLDLFNFISNSSLIIKTETKFATETVIFDTTDPNSLSHNRQVEMAFRSNIIIATHGAFESNIIYMRDRTLFIELCGDYQNAMPESENYARLARLFSVFRRRVIVEDLHSPIQPSYIISTANMNNLLVIIVSYLKYSMEQRN